MLVVNSLLIKAVIVFLLPALMMFLLKFPAEKSFAIVAGFFSFLYFLFCLYICRDYIVSFNLLGCVVYSFISFFGIPYVVLVMLGATTGLFMKKLI